MSEKQMHRQRWNAKLEFIMAYDAWLHEEPPIWKIISWRRWQKRRPIYEEYVK